MVRPTFPCDTSELTAPGVQDELGSTDPTPAEGNTPDEVEVAEVVLGSGVEIIVVIVKATVDDAIVGPPPGEDVELLAAKTATRTATAANTNRDRAQSARYGDSVTPSPPQGPEQGR
jgi:hypothetical protein